MENLYLTTRNRRRSLHYVFIALLFWGNLSSPDLLAIPQFTLLTGNRCINCHVQPQGGGLRNELGWYSYSDVGMLLPESIGLGKIYEAISESNSFFNGTLTIGFDFRLQSARKHNSPDAQRRTFPMQASVYAALTPVDWVTWEGGYNFGPQRYAGQQAWNSSLIIQPSVEAPQFRIGFFRPPIGIRYDDHTILTAQIPTTVPTSLIPPAYAEWGALLTYEGIKWATIAAGAFSASNFAENQLPDENGIAIPIVDKKAIFFLGRILLWPSFRYAGIHTYGGASAYVCQDFSLWNIFAGFGIEDQVSLWIEYAQSEKLGLRETNALSIEVLYHLSEWLFPYIRAETGGTTLLNTETPQKSYAQQVNIGFQWFLLPYLEFRPEYRLLDTDAYRSTRYAFQFHFFY